MQNQKISVLTVILLMVTNMNVFIIGHHQQIDTVGENVDPIGGSNSVIIENSHLSIKANIIDLDNDQAAIIISEFREKDHDFLMDLYHSPLWILELWDVSSRTPKLFPDPDTVLEYNGCIPADRDKLSIFTLNDSCMVFSWIEIPISDTNMKANITMKVSLTGSSGPSTWDIEADLYGDDLILIGIRFPVFLFNKYGSSSEDDRLVFPLAGGLLVRDPIHAHHDIKDDPWYMNQEWSYFQHPGNIKNQFFAYYGGDEDGNPCFYVAACDRHLNYKRLYYNSINSRLVAYITNYLAVDPSNKESLKHFHLNNDLRYTITVDMFQGDWYDCTQVYRKWLSSAKPDFLPAKLIDREDIPVEAKETSYIPKYSVSSNTYSIDPVVAENRIKQLRDYLLEQNVSIPFIFLPITRAPDYNVSPEVDNLGSDGDYCPIIKGGPDLMDTLWRNYGIACIANRDTGQWMRNPDTLAGINYTALNAEKKCIILRPDGSPVKRPWSSDTVFTTACQWILERRVNLVERLFNDSRNLSSGNTGTGYLGIMLSGQGVIPKLDFSPAIPWADHTENNHTIPGGNFWSENWRDLTEMLVNLHSVDPMFILTTERANEFLIGLPHTIPGALHSHQPFYVDALGRTPPILTNAEPIPISEAIYHDYGVRIPELAIRSLYASIYDNCKDTTEQDGAIALALHQAAVAIMYGEPLTINFAYNEGSSGKKGNIYFKYDGLPNELSPIWRDVFDYEIRLAAARSHAKSYLIYGKMLRPPEIDGQKKEVKFIRNGNVVKQDITPVVGSAWRAPDGSIAIAITNPMPEAININLALDRDSMGIDKGTYVLVPIYSSPSNSHFNQLILECNSNRICDINIPAHSVVVYRIQKSTGISITKPRNGLYIFDRKILPLHGTVVVGGVTITVETSEDTSKVEFYIDNNLKYTDDTYPFSWFWDEQAFGMHNIKVLGYNQSGTCMDGLSVIRIT